MKNKADNRASTRRHYDTICMRSAAGSMVVSSKGTSYFNDMLGTTLGSKAKGKKYSAAALTAFGEDLSSDTKGESSTHSTFSTLNSQFFTGKPHVAGLGHAFLFRNYRASLGKWQTADPLGYPDGWNPLVYCKNSITFAVDFLGCDPKVVGTDTEDAPSVVHDMGIHVHEGGVYNGRSCHWYIIDTFVYDITIMQDFTRKRRWETIDGLENVLNGIGYGLDFSGGLLVLTGAGSIPAGGVLIGGVLFHSAADMLNYLNGWIDVPTGEKIRVKSDIPRYVDSFELHVLE